MENNFQLLIKELFEKTFIIEDQIDELRETIEKIYELLSQTA